MELERVDTKRAYKQIRERMGNALTGPEISAMLERRDTIVAHIQKLIEQRPGSVLYDRQ